MNKANALEVAARKLKSFKRVKVEGNVVNMAARTRVEVMPIMQYLGFYETLVPHKDQRDHLYRLESGKAEHVKTLHIAHTEVVVAYYDGEFHLTDGNHRSYIWANMPDADKPSHVTVIIKAPQTEEEYLSLYACYDSPKQNKGGRDNLQGYFRHHGLQFQSEILRAGAIPSAMKRLASGNTAAHLRKAVKDYKEALYALDSLNLKKSGLSMGYVLAALKIFQANKGDLTAPLSFMKDIIYAHKISDAGVSKAACTVVNKIKMLGRSGEKPIDRDCKLVVAAYEAYVAELAAAHAPVVTKAVSKVTPIKKTSSSAKK